MAAMQNCLQLAVDRKAQEILFNSLEPLRLRVGKDLVPVAMPQLSSHEMRQLLSQILNEDERKCLYENLKIQGAKTLGSVSFKFDLQIDFEGVKGSLILQNPSVGLWNFPALAMESVFKSQGLNLVIGGRRSGKTAAIHQILQSGQNRKKVIAVYTDEEVPGLISEGNIVSQFPVQQLSVNGAPKSADLVVIDSSQVKLCEMALRLAEEGRSVLLAMPFWNIQMGLQRLMDLCEGTEQSRARRLSSVLQMALGLRLMPGIDCPFQGAFELLVVESEVQKALLSMNFQEISYLMKSTAERTGMRSLNQSLFQLLMKRKIELKTAFEASSEPEELDSLLKKVGI